MISFTEAKEHIMMSCLEYLIDRMNLSDCNIELFLSYDDDKQLFLSILLWNNDYLKDQVMEMVVNVYETFGIEERELFEAIAEEMQLNNTKLQH